ncbi:DUF4357 domain-containing protein [Azospirillum sp. sgz302134]
MEQARMGSRAFRLDYKTIKVIAYLLPDGGFLVPHGARAWPEEGGSLYSAYRKRRADLRAEGILVEHGSGLVFTADVILRCASEASGVVTGQNINGVRAWKPLDGAGPAPRALRPKTFEARRPALRRALQRLADELADLGEVEAMQLRDNLCRLAQSVGSPG